MKNVSALIGGVLFGAGLVVAGMTNPEKVLAFLTIGPMWDATLIFVLGSAVTITGLGYWLVGRRSAPLFATEFHAPTQTMLDARLLGGSGLFGVGWGLSGFCPGPAIVGAMTLDPRALVFLSAFVVGVLVYERLLTPPSAPAAATADG